MGRVLKCFPCQRCLIFETMASSIPVGVTCLDINAFDIPPMSLKFNRLAVMEMLERMMGRMVEWTVEPVSQSCHSL